MQFPAAVWPAPALALALSACTTPLPRNSTTPIYEYHTDGCTLSPDLNVLDCCEAHDRAYWRGGSCEERKQADRVLRSCIQAHDHSTLDDVYYAAVRVSGSPLWPVPWRWGFGWPYGMGYSEECE